MGRQLKEVTNAEGKTQFEYDANGLRTQKRIYRPDGRLLFTANYIWENGILSSQTLVVARYNLDGTSASDIVFSSKIIYDDNNQPVGYIVNSDAVYMFVRNLQGDVIALIDDEGDTILEYSYDPWGKLEYKFTNPNMDETAAIFLTSLCPLTYRGYNYDFSTGLYYLQSRYYNPEWGRFLNADTYLETGNGVTGSNVFAYCDNNPVNKTDKNGKYSEGISQTGEIIMFALCLGELVRTNLLPYFYTVSSGTKEYHLLDASYNFTNWEDITVKVTMMTGIGVTYCEAKFQIRTINEWQNMLYNNDFSTTGKIMDTIFFFGGFMPPGVSGGPFTEFLNKISDVGDLAKSITRDIPLFFNRMEKYINNLMKGYISNGQSYNDYVLVLLGTYEYRLKELYGRKRRVDERYRYPY